MWCHAGTRAGPRALDAAGSGEGPCAPSLPGPPRAPGPRPAAARTLGCSERVAGSHSSWAPRDAARDAGKRRTRLVPAPRCGCFCGAPCFSAWSSSPLRTLSQAQGQLVCQAGVRRRPGNPHRGKGRVGRPCCHSPGRLGVTAAGPSGRPCPARRLSPRTRTTGLPCLGPSWGCARTRMTDGAPTQGGDGVGASPGLTFPTAACWWKKASDVRCKWTGHQILICSHCVLNTELFIHFESAGSTKHVKIKENKLDSVTKNGSTIFIRRLI